MDLRAHLLISMPKHILMHLSTDTYIRLLFTLLYHTKKEKDAKNRNLFTHTV